MSDKIPSYIGEEALKLVGKNRREGKHEFLNTAGNDDLDELISNMSGSPLQIDLSGDFFGLDLTEEEARTILKVAEDFSFHGKLCKFQQSKTDNNVPKSKALQDFEVEFSNLEALLMEDDSVLQNKKTSCDKKQPNFYENKLRLSLLDKLDNIEKKCEFEKTEPIRDRRFTKFKFLDHVDPLCDMSDISDLDVNDNKNDELVGLKNKVNTTFDKVDGTSVSSAANTSISVKSFQDYTFDVKNCDLNSDTSNVEEKLNASIMKEVMGDSFDSLNNSCNGVKRKTVAKKHTIPYAGFATQSSANTTFNSHESISYKTKSLNAQHNYATNNTFAVTSQLDFNGNDTFSVNTQSICNGNNILAVNAQHKSNANNTFAISNQHDANDANKAIAVDTREISATFSSENLKANKKPDDINRAGNITFNANPKNTYNAENLNVNVTFNANNLASNNQNVNTTFNAKSSNFNTTYNGKHANVNTSFDAKGLNVNNTFNYENIAYDKDSNDIRDNKFSASGNYTFSTKTGSPIAVYNTDAQNSDAIKSEKTFAIKSINSKLNTTYEKALESKIVANTTYEKALESKNVANTTCEKPLESKNVANTTYEKALESENGAKATYEKALESENVVNTTYEKALESKNVANTTYEKALESENVVNTTYEKTLESKPKTVVNTTCEKTLKSKNVVNSSCDITSENKNILNTTYDKISDSLNAANTTSDKISKDKNNVNSTYDKVSDNVNVINTTFDKISKDKNDVNTTYDKVSDNVNVINTTFDKLSDNFNVASYATNVLDEQKTANVPKIDQQDHKMNASAVNQNSKNKPKKRRSFLIGLEEDKQVNLNGTFEHIGKGSFIIEGKSTNLLDMQPGELKTVLSSTSVSNKRKSDSILIDSSAPICEKSVNKRLCNSYVSANDNKVEQETLPQISNKEIGIDLKNKFRNPIQNEAISLKFKKNVVNINPSGPVKAIRLPDLHSQNKIRHEENLDAPRDQTKTFTKKYIKTKEKDISSKNILTTLPIFGSMSSIEDESPQIEKKFACTPVALAGQRQIASTPNVGNDGSSTRNHPLTKTLLTPIAPPKEKIRNCGLNENGGAAEEILEHVEKILQPTEENKKSHKPKIVKTAQKSVNTIRESVLSKKVASNVRKSFLNLPKKVNFLDKTANVGDGSSKIIKFPHKVGYVAKRSPRYNSPYMSNTDSKSPNSNNSSKHKNTCKKPPIASTITKVIIPKADGFKSVSRSSITEINISEDVELKPLSKSSFTDVNIHKDADTKCNDNSASYNKKRREKSLQSERFLRNPDIVPRRLISPKVVSSKANNNFFSRKHRSSVLVKKLSSSRTSSHHSLESCKENLVGGKELVRNAGELETLQKNPLTEREINLLENDVSVNVDKNAVKNIAGSSKKMISVAANGQVFKSGAVKAHEIKLEAIKDQRFKSEEIQYQEIKSETIKVPGIKSETIKVPGIKSEIIKIPGIKSETNKNQVSKSAVINQGIKSGIPRSRLPAPTKSRLPKPK